MYDYRIYGLLIRTDYEFEEAIEIEHMEDETPDVVIHQGVIDKALTTETEREQHIENRYVYRYEKQRGWIRAPRQGCFVMYKGEEVVYQLKEEHDPLMVNQFFLCAVLPLVLIQRGRLAVHGSGIVSGDASVIITGESGSGKSTLAEKMLQEGKKFCADDTVAIRREGEVVYTYPAYPQQKVCADAVKAYGLDVRDCVLLPEDEGVRKYAIRDREKFCNEKKPLKALVVVAKADVEKPQLEEITGNEKVKYVLNNLYKYAAYQKMGLGPETFLEVVKTAAAIRVVVLKRPLTGMTVNGQMALLKEHGILD